MVKIDFFHSMIKALYRSYYELWSVQKLKYEG